MVKFHLNSNKKSESVSQELQSSSDSCAVNGRFFRILLTVPLISSLITMSAHAQLQPQIATPLTADAIESWNANSSERPITYFQFRHPETKEIIELQYQPTSPEKLKKTTYRGVKAQWRAQLEQACKGKGFGVITKDFLIEWVAFSAAVMANASIHLNDDPAGTTHSAQSMIYDPMSIPGFAAFVFGSRMMTKGLELGGLAVNPCLSLKLGRFEVTQNKTGYRVGSPELNAKVGAYSASTKPLIANPGPYSSYAEYEYTKLQSGVLQSGETRGFTREIGFEMHPPKLASIMRWFAGPLALSGGLFLSNIVSEMAKDENFRLCARSKYDAKVAADKAEEACEQAWEDWKLSRKLHEWIPDMLAMGAASVVQGLIYSSVGMVPQALAKATNVQVVADPFGRRVFDAYAVRKSGEKYIPLVLRTFKFSAQVGKFVSGGWGKFFFTIGNIWLFLEVVHPITPLIKVPMETARLGNEVTEFYQTLHEELTELEKNKWTVKQLTEEEYCPDFYNTVSHGLPYIEFTECVLPPQVSPLKILKTYNRSMKKWREFLLQEPLMTHKNWSDYSKEFLASYSNTQNIYREFAAMINRTLYSAKPDDRRSELLTSHPFFGVDLDIKKRTVLRVDQPDESEVAPDDVYKLYTTDIMTAYLAYQQLSKGGSDLLSKSQSKSTGGAGQVEVELGKSDEVVTKLKEAAAPLEGIQRATVFLQSFLKAELNSSDRIRTAKMATGIADLLQVLKGLRAVDPRIPIEQVSKAAIGFRRLDKMSDDQRVSFEIQTRVAEYKKALEVLFASLHSRTHVFHDFNNDPESETYKVLARNNPMMQVRLLLGNPKPLPAGVGWLFKMEQDSTLVDQESRFMHPQRVGLVATPTITDYLLASAVCGPEVENMAANKVLEVNPSPVRQSLIGNWYEAAKSYIRLKLSSEDKAFVVEQPIVELPEPKLLPKASGISGRNEGTPFSEWRGVQVEFHPPRLIKKSIGINFCMTPPDGEKGYISALQKLGIQGAFDIHRSQWTYNGKTYRGFLDILKQEIKPSLVFGKIDAAEKRRFEVPFLDFWEKNMDPYMTEAAQRIRRNYQEMIITKYLPAMTSSEARIFESRSKKNNGQTERRQLNLGVFNSLVSDLKVDLNIIRMAMFGQNPNPQDPAVAQFVTSAQAMLESFEGMRELLSNKEIFEMKGDKARRLFTDQGEKIQKAQAELMYAVNMHYKQNKTNYNDLKKDFVFQAVKNVDEYLNEMQSYYAVLKGLSPSGF